MTTKPSLSFNREPERLQEQRLSGAVPPAVLISLLAPTAPTVHDVSHPPLLRAFA